MHSSLDIRVILLWFEALCRPKKPLSVHPYTFERHIVV